jgi:hypothetical protein
LTEDSANIILLNYTTMIRKISRVVYNNFKIRKSNKHDTNYQMLLVDNLNYYDMADDTIRRCYQVEMSDRKEVAFLNDCLDLVCRSFRFL